MAGEQNQIFKGCTRPPMMLGVPLTALVKVLAPFFMVTGLTMLISLGWAVVLAIITGLIYLMMRFVAAHDDHAFHLLGLMYQFRYQGKNRNRNQKLWGASAYAPFSFKRESIETPIPLRIIAALKSRKKIKPKE